MQFNTLEDCFKAVKKDTTNYRPTAEGDFCIVQKESDNSMLKELMQTVAVLNSQVSYLVAVINKDKSRNVNAPPPNNFLKANKSIKCFNCNKLGHYASSCTNTPFCINCDKRGHNLRSCKNRNKVVRQLERDDNINEDEYAAIDTVGEVENPIYILEEVNSLEEKKDKNFRLLQSTKSGKTH